MAILDTHKLLMLKSYEPRETGTHIAQFLTDTSVRPIGKWRGPARVGGTRIGGFSFALIEFGAQMALQASVHADHFLILCCLRGSVRMNIDGDQFTIGAGRGVIARPSSYLKGEFSSDCIRLAIRIDAHLLDPDSYPDHEEFDIENGPMRPWFELVQFMLSSPPLMEMAASDPALVESMESMLFRLLQSTSPLLSRSSQSPAASRDVRRAEIFIRAHAAHDISLADIVAAADANARTLQNNFMRYRNMTPMQYLRKVRLDRARDLLLTGTVQVADAAFESGFTHQGRFASHYRARFGESPSATLRRAGQMLRTIN